MSALNLTEMAIFATVASQGSVTKAAEKLDMPKSTVSRRLSLLEEQLGVRLINRTTRKLKLTEIGAMYYEQCERMLEAAEDASQIVHRMQAEPSGLLRVSTPLALGEPFLLELIESFLADHKKVNIEIVMENRYVDLVDEGIDVAIRVGPLADSSLIAQRLGPAQIIACATPEYLQKHGEPTTPEELVKHALIRHPSAPLLMNVAGKEVLFADEPKMLVNDMVMIKDMVLRHVGIGVFSTIIALQYIKDGRLVPILKNYPFPERDFHLVYPSRRQMAPKVVAFINYILAVVRPKAPWDISPDELFTE